MIKLPSDPCSFPETFEDLHAVKGLKMSSHYAHGCSIIDNLRIARGRFSKSLKTLTRCTQTAVEDEPRYDYGRYLDGVVDDLSSGKLESMDWNWFMRRAETVMECVIDAESQPEEDLPSPEKPTWSDFRALSAALREHGESIKQLYAAEKRAGSPFFQ